MPFQTLDNFCSLVLLPRKQKGSEYFCWELDFCFTVLWALPKNMYFLTYWVSVKYNALCRLEIRLKVTDVT